MTLGQIVFTALLIAALLGLIGFYAWKQVQALRKLRGDDNLPPEDRKYFRNQAWRRLAGCALMAVLAALLAGSLLFEGPAHQFAEERAAAREAGEEPFANDAQKQFARFYGFYWIGLLLTLLVLMGMAFVDFLAIRRYGQRHYRQLQADRRAMIDRQAARMRQQRNGHG